MLPLRAWFLALLYSVTLFGAAAVGPGSVSQDTGTSGGQSPPGNSSNQPGTGPDNTGPDENSVGPTIRPPVLYRFEGTLRMATGEAVPRVVPVELDCGPTFDIDETFADKQGRFSFDTAYTSNRRGRAIGGPTSGADFRRCRVRVLLKGYLGRSPVPIESDGLRSPLLRIIDLGVTTLYELDPSKGVAVSMTSYEAPVRARRSYTRGLAALRKEAADLNEARKHFEDAVKEYARYAEAWLALGEVRVKQGQSADARHSWEQSIAADPHFYKPYPKLTALTVEAADWARTAELAARWKRIRPGDTQAKMYESVARLNLGELDIASRLAKAVLQSPDAEDHPEAHHIVGMVHQAHGELTEAAREYRLFIARRPDGPAAAELNALIARWEMPSEPTGRPAIVIEVPAPAVDLGATVTEPLPAPPARSAEQEKSRAVERVREVMRRRLLLSPRYSCEQLVDRTVKYHSPNAIPTRARFRLEVAFVGDRDLYSWPGANNFGEVSLPELLGYGVASSGEFAAHARGIFLSDRSELRLVGEDDRDGHRTLHFTLALEEQWSDYWFEYPGGRLRVAYSGEFWADPVSYEVTRLVLRVDDSRLSASLRTAQTEIEYKVFTLGGSKTWLPSQAQVDLDAKGGASSTNHYRFSNCRSFMAESTISFGIPDLPTTASSEPAGGGRLPAGLSLPVRLLTALDSRMVAGDPLDAELEKDVQYGQALLPKGSKVFGRIRRLEWFGDPQRAALVGLEFDAVEVGEKRLAMGGNLRRILIPGMQRTNTLDLRLDRIAQTRVLIAESFALLPRQQRSAVGGQFFLLGSTFAVERGSRVTWMTR